MESHKLIVIFFTHAGGVKFKKLCNKRGIDCELMPVPRALSSSCGICGLIDGDVDISILDKETVERIVSSNGYSIVFKAI